MPDLRTRAIVLRRTNYGETDRILNFLTPDGKVAAIARGVRKERSKLAGGIELFSVADVVIHQRSASPDAAKSLGILTGAKMLKFYQNILASLPRLELASDCLKRLDRASEQADNPEFFALLEQVFAGLDAGLPESLVATWFRFNFSRATGEDLNLIRDVAGNPLNPVARYVWDGLEQALRLDPAGPLSAREVKLARLMLVSRLATIAKVEGVMDILPAVACIVAERA